jgi:hypothetical protein
VAAGLTRLGRWVLAAASLAFILGACTSLDRPTVQADEVALPTPLRSYSTSVASAIRQLEAAVSGTGNQLEVPSAAYRPSEPASLLQLPRVVLRADLADSGDGFVVIYETAGRSAALERARDLADYLASGFGQTNYLADTQFSVAVLDGTVIFTTWSSRGSDDPDRAEAVFDAVAGVGEPVEVAK